MGIKQPIICIAFIPLADIAHALGILSSVDGIKFAGLILWGFGLWAFVFTLSLTIKYLKAGGIPFSLSWWAFLFPMAAYTLATLMVYDYSKIKLILGYAIILSLLLIVIWIVTFAKTLLASLNGKLFSPPSMPKKI
ncbi:MAG TPA: hypothetical protein VFC40_00200 [Syntrophomonas sp.]|nr:hypothetical protein [Syntrophomonas sp.]